MIKDIWKNLEIKTAAIVLAVVALLTAGLYYTVFDQYNRLIISQLQDNAVIINEYVQKEIDEASFLSLNTRDDEQTELYIDTHTKLDEVRRIANLLYLYTVKIDENGSYIYVVDGLDEEDIDEDGYFCHVGDPVEDDIIALVEQCFNGDVVLGNEILSTDWGNIFVAYFPFLDSDGNIIGAVGMEFDCDSTYNAMNRVRMTTIIIALAISIIFSVLAYTFIRRTIKNAENAFRDIEKEKTAAQEMINSVMNASPMCCQFWNRDFKVIDCNEATYTLFGYASKQDYLNNWLAECNPEYQPDGQRSETKGFAMLEKAFAEGRCVFDWTHLMKDGTLMPAEVTFVHVKSGTDDFIAAYTRDLTRERELEEQVGDVFYDKLTGVYTKKYLEDKLTRVIRILSRSSGELSILMVSIDFFDQYYQKYGEQEGNKCLRSVAQMLDKVSRRADDFVAHYREGDFVITLPNTNKIGAQMIAGELIEQMNKMKIPHASSSVSSHVTISIGVTSGKVFHRHRADDYINRAQEMLYISKQSGRNKSSYADL